MNNQTLANQIIEELRAIVDDAIHPHKGYYDSLFFFWLVKCRVRWEYAPWRPHPAALLGFILAVVFALVLSRVTP